MLKLERPLLIRTQHAVVFSYEDLVYTKIVVTRSKGTMISVYNFVWCSWCSMGFIRSRTWTHARTQIHRQSDPQRERERERERASERERERDSMYVMTAHSCLFIVICLFVIKLSKTNIKMSSSSLKFSDPRHRERKLAASQKYGTETTIPRQKVWNY